MNLGVEERGGGRGRKVCLWESDGEGKQEGMGKEGGWVKERRAGSYLV